MKYFQSFLTFVVPLLSLIDAFQLSSSSSSSSSKNQQQQHGDSHHLLSSRLPSLYVQSPPPQGHVVKQVSFPSSRRGFLHDAMAKTATAAALVLLSPLMLVRAAHANDGVATTTTDVVPVSSSSNKKILSDEALKEIILSDIVDRQFLVTGQLTLSAYEATAKWKDEIDTYEIQKWVTGTQKLFVGEQSSVRLVGDIAVTPEKVEFRFDEDLMFNIPFRPTVHLTGRVVLDRNPETGLISFGREIWDDSVATVLKSAKF